MGLTQTSMKQTRSGDYKIPGPLARRVGNVLVSVAAYIPASLRVRYARRRPYYQVFEGEQVGDRQGLSINKWNAMRMPASLTGKSVLDIGCADGFFCQLCSRHGTISAWDRYRGGSIAPRPLRALDEGLDIKCGSIVFQPEDASTV